MLERLLVVAIVFVLVSVAAIVVRRRSGVGADRLRRSDPTPLWSALGARPDGRPALVVFSSLACVACRTAQRPAVEIVAERFGAVLRVVHLDIGAQPAAARAFGVMTAPSTAVLAGDGSLQSLNHGFAPADRLAAQVSAAGGRPAFAGWAPRPAVPARWGPGPADRR